jgi:hypothetical protein
MLNATPDRINDMRVNLRRIRRGPLACFLLIFAGVFALCAQEEHAGLADTVRMIATTSAVGGRRMPEVGKNDVVVRQRRDTLRVLLWEPMGRTRAGLDLFILIDGASRHSQDFGTGEKNSYAISPWHKTARVKVFLVRWNMQATTT